MARIRVFHNISWDASFGLNMALTPEGRFIATPGKRHELVLVFEYDSLVTTDSTSYSDHTLLADAFHTFNVGSNDLAATYRVRRLRSLSVGDLVEIDGRAYSCESAGWKAIPHDGMYVLDAAEAERVIRLRYFFDPGEDLCITVPLSTG